MFNRMRNLNTSAQLIVIINSSNFCNAMFVPAAALADGSNLQEMVLQQRQLVVSKGVKDLDASKRHLALLELHLVMHELRFYVGDCARSVQRIFLVGLVRGGGGVSGGYFCFCFIKVKKFMLPSF